MLDRLKKPVMTLRYSLHDFRHAAASLRIEPRGKPKRGQTWRGHSLTGVTFDTCAHLFDQADPDSAVVAIEREQVGYGRSESKSRSELNGIGAPAKAGAQGPAAVPLRPGLLLSQEPKLGPSEADGS